MAGGVDRGRGVSRDLCGRPVLLSSNTIPWPYRIGAMLGNRCDHSFGRHLQDLDIPYFSNANHSVFGLISYSLYLWHWPLFVFYRFFDDPSNRMRFLIAAFSIGVATRVALRRAAIRTKVDQSGVRRTLVVAGATIVASVGSALLFTSAVERFWKLPDSVKRCWHTPTTTNMKWCGRAPARWVLESLTTLRSTIGVRCLSLAPDKRNFLIVGDSHAADLW